MKINTTFSCEDQVVALPNLGNIFINLIKGTSLAESWRVFFVFAACFWEDELLWEDNCVNDDLQVDSLTWFDHL
ncbi:hypothetical protein [Paenibacillus sp. N3.4]|uniref:hypothetical protein n=1 Tax=Paenibacillus sp. N3.4 TaxID=2603222 RepID=UPI00164F677B|nr:hypothetical protein [Paenibacillus sp. N3.4]